MSVTQHCPLKAPIKSLARDYILLDTYNSYNFQDMEAAVTGNGEDTYDAYEKDIAFVTFYFEEPTVFEYTRHVKESRIIAGN